ncbi:MAG: ABC transporter substrate-binding protein [Treponema sp.]|jgi:peptide/nickel transport system substrate-binding protein|nr:ABC transporter substrate-binding protein [Treponema sp.]
MKKNMLALAGLCVLAVSCARDGELSLEEIEAAGRRGTEEILAKTTSKPWRGEEFASGSAGGVWNSSSTGEPKSFNLLVAERDADTADIVGRMHDYLMDYDVVRREWTGRCVTGEVLVDEAAGTLDVIYTLRDNLYWSFYENVRPPVPVTSGDVIFWYDEIEGDPEFQSSRYNSQFITMEDGSRERITIRKIDDKRFAFHFPRIVAEPFLATNMEFGPAFIYREAKEKGGTQGVLDLFNVSVDPKTIPSMGRWFLTEYSPGQRLVYKRNPDYWKKDSAGQSVPYPEESIVQILPDQNTEFLVFKEGGLEAYQSRPEDLNELVENQDTGTGSGYTVFNAEGSLGAMLWSFNQNPQNKDTPQYEWFTQKEFRQAMSRLLNRDRIISQVYRGLAEPKLDFFPAPNPYYSPDITLRYLYDTKQAAELLASIGIKRDREGVMRDSQGRQIEFDLSIPSDATVVSDTASIIRDEMEKLGITVNIRAVDFQKLVEQLTATYDWQSIIIGLGAPLFPTQGSNVWPSDGNLHLWYPLQEKPATEWEARIDYLYNEGMFTIDKEKARGIWNEYQQIILEQCPVIYLLRPRSFYALRNRWDFTNFYYDNLNGPETSQIFLAK